MTRHPYCHLVIAGLLVATLLSAVPAPAQFSSFGSTVGRAMMARGMMKGLGRSPFGKGPAVGRSVTGSARGVGTKGLPGARSSSPKLSGAFSKRTVSSRVTTTSRRSTPLPKGAPKPPRVTTASRSSSPVSTSKGSTLRDRVATYRGWKSSQGIQGRPTTKQFREFQARNGTFRSKYAQFESRTSTRFRRQGVAKAWQQERTLVKATGKGTRKWSPQEKSQLVRTGRVKGYDGHHIKSVSSRSGDVSNPNNIRFVTRAEHHRLHGGNWKTPTYGKPIDRTRILNGRVSKM